MMKTRTIIIGISLISSLVPMLAWAALPEDIQQKREAVKQDIQQKRDALKQEMQQKRDALKKEFEQKRDALKQEFEKKREQFKVDAKMRTEELKKKLGEKRARQIEMFFNRMVEKFQGAVERLKNLADRIDSRLNKAEANGKDVKTLRGQLAKAREKITDAQKALEDAKIKYSEAAKEPDFKVAFEKVKDIVKVLNGKVKDAHRALVDVINSIKGLGKGTAKEEEKAERTVEITSAGFAPPTLKIKVGTTVRFVNRDSQLHWPASGAHPTHGVCPGFDASKSLAPGESYSFIFKEAKICPMHDHLNPSTTGSIVVE